MRVEHVHLRRAPGFPDGFRLAELAPGVNLVVGPNASGKSTLCRAVRASLWKEEPFDGASVEVVWRSGARVLVSDRVGARSPSWSDSGGVSEAPRRPDAHLRRCFGLELEELLTGGDEAESAIARNLRLELSDGQDAGLVLREARALTFKSAETARGAFESARQRLAAVEQAQSELAEDEQRLARLQRELQQARVAREELGAYETAADLARARTELAGLDELAASFPTGMDRLPEDAPALAAERKRGEGEAAAALRDARAELDELERELAAVDLDAQEVAHLGAAPLAERREHLATLDREREVAARALAASTVEAGGVETPPRANGLRPLAGDELDRLEGQVEREQALASQLEELRTRRGAGSSGEAPAEPVRSLAPGIVALAVAFLALVGLALADGLPLGARAAGVALALGLAAVGVRLIVGALPSWMMRDREAARVAEAERAHEEHRRVAGRLAQAREERAAALRELGLEAETGALSSVVLARRLAEREAGARRLAGERRALASFDERLASEVAHAVELARALRRPEPSDPVEARALLAALERDRERAARLCARAPRQEARVGRAREALARQEQGRAELYDTLGLELGDDGGLQERANRRHDWLELRARRAGLRKYISEREGRLTGRGRLTELDQEQLDEQIAARRARSAELDELQREVSGIEARCDVAQRQRELEQARAGLEAARAALAQKRDELVFGALAEHLMSDVVASHRREAQPALVRRAAEHLARFTAARYTLEVASETGGDALPLRVREDGELRDIRQLSSGTRAQLRIALRIAVAEAAEDGEEPLPIFLDEALANSDARRFDAVVAALGALASEGRQVFYLTADADEAQRFGEALVAAGYEEARGLHLGAATRRAQAAPGLPPRARSAPPAIEGHDGESYLLALGAPRLDPFAPAQAAHLAWLLADDLPALRDMLEEGVETLGRAREVLERDWTSAWNTAQRERFEARARALEAFVGAWSVGRARTLDEVTLTESPLQRSDKFAGVLDLAREVAWDAEVLIEELRAKGADRDERVKRVPKRLVEAAAEEWAERGYYDPREVQDRATCFDEVAGALEGELRAGSATLGELELLVDRWWRALESGAVPGGAVPGDADQSRSTSSGTTISSG